MQLTLLCYTTITIKPPISQETNFRTLKSWGSTCFNTGNFYKCACT